ncbi:MAG: DUF3667 domain-containing protein [Ferruginibacter sp.]|nr:DUF3667 domain-containing protein [Cytophagales bacterium]
MESPHRYCPGCGQKTPWRRFTLLDAFREFSQAFTDLDRGFLHLIKQLAFRPGIVAREYVLEGKRKRYFNPFSLLLLVLGLYLSVNALTNPYTKAGRIPQPPAARQSRPVDPPASGPAIRERQRKVQALLEEYTNLVGLLAIPVLALVYSLYFRHRIYYAEHLVANVLFASYYSIVSLLATLLLGLFFRAYLGFLNSFLLLFQWGYLTLAYYQFLSYRHPRQYLITAWATLLALLAWIGLTGGTIFYYVRYGWVLGK